GSGSTGTRAGRGRPPCPPSGPPRTSTRGVAAGTTSPADCGPRTGRGRQTPASAERLGPGLRSPDAACRNRDSAACIGSTRPPGQRIVVARRLEHELAGATGRDHVEHADAFADQLPLDAKVGIAGRDDSHAPPRAVGRRTILPVGRNLDGGGFIAGAVWAVV